MTEKCGNEHEPSIRQSPGYTAELESLKSPNRKFKQVKNRLIESLLFGGTQLQACITPWSSDSGTDASAGTWTGLRRSGSSRGCGGTQPNHAPLWLMVHLCGSGDGLPAWQMPCQLPCSHCWLLRCHPYLPLMIKYMVEGRRKWKDLVTFFKTLLFLQWRTLSSRYHAVERVKGKVWQLTKPSEIWWAWFQQELCK